MNFPNVLKFPQVCISELAMASCAITLLDYLVYFSFLFPVRLWQITPGRRTYICFFLSFILWLSSSFSSPGSTCIVCWDWGGTGQCQSDPLEVCPWTGTPCHDCSGRVLAAVSPCVPQQGWKAVSVLSLLPARLLHSSVAQLPTKRAPGCHQGLTSEWWQQAKPPWSCEPRGLC